LIRRLRFLLTAALLCFQAPTVAHADAGQRPAGAGAASASVPASGIATPALWVVRDEDTTLYIFGTSHMLPQGVEWLRGPVRQAFAQADTLVLEMVQPENPAVLRPLIMRLGLNPQGTTLSSQLPEKLRAQITQAATQVGLPAAALEPMRPWLAATTIAVAGLQGLGLDPSHGVEHVLTSYARSSGKRITGLETAEQQFGFLASLPEEDQLALLRSSIEDLETLRTEASTLMTSWMRGDIETVGKLMNESLKESPHLAKILLTERNQRWAAWIDQRMDEPGRVFLAVGAGHLAGRDGLIRLLERKGLKVERVATEASAPAGARP